MNFLGDYSWVQGAGEGLDQADETVVSRSASVVSM